MAGERPHLTRRSSSYMLLMQVIGTRSREELLSLTQTNRNSFVTSQKQFLMLIREFSERKEALSDGTNELVVNDGTVCVRPRSPMTSRKRKQNLHKTLTVLQDTLPQQRTRKLHQAILDLTNSLRVQHPDCADVLNNIQKGTVVTVLSDVIRVGDIERLLTFDENMWTPKHIAKLLRRGNSTVSNAHYLSTVLVAKWMELETLETCLRRDSAITHLLKFWITTYDDDNWIVETDTEISCERRALIHFVDCLRRVQGWPEPLLKVVRMMQTQIDVRRLQDGSGASIMITVLMLRHFIPLYHMHSQHANRTEVARAIMSYCESVPTIAQEHYQEVSKLLRA